MSELGNWRRYLSEWGCGAVLTHENQTLAAIRALRNAISRVCHMNFEPLGNIDLSKDVLVDVVVGVPKPKEVHVNELIKEIPLNCTKRVKVVNGGLEAEGAYNEELGRNVKVVIAVAYITIYVKTSHGDV